MNEFDINTDRWYIDGFAYDKDEGHGEQDDMEYMELMRAAHLKAKEKKMTWAKLPLYFTEHAYDFVVRSEI